MSIANKRDRSFHKVFSWFHKVGWSCRNFDLLLCISEKFIVEFYELIFFLYDNWYRYRSCAAGSIAVENYNDDVKVTLSKNYEDDVKVRLRSGDGHIISVDKEVAIESKVLKNIIQNVGEDQLPHQVMPVSTVSKQTLEKMFEYVEYHVRNSSLPANVMRTWDLNFITNVDIEMLSDLKFLLCYLITIQTQIVWLVVRFVNCFWHGMQYLYLHCTQQIFWVWIVFWIWQLKDWPGINYSSLKL